jgi:ribonuclease BN (tRNA processing enzyme)
MNIQFLGSGGAFPDYRINYNNNSIVETSQGWVLIDCGQTASQSLSELGIHPAELHAILITHIHCDHASPQALIWQRYYSSIEGPPGFLPTPIYSPKDVIEPLIESIQPYVGIYNDQNTKIRTDGAQSLIEAHATMCCTFGDTEFSFFPVHHVHQGDVDKPAYGIRITQKNKRVYWSGDTIFSPEWIHSAAEDPMTQTIFHECTFSPIIPGTAHTHWEELKTLPDHVLEKIVLMHHTEVPSGVSIYPLQGAAQRHQVFSW